METYVLEGTAQITSTKLSRNVSSLKCNYNRGDDDDNAQPAITVTGLAVVAGDNAMPEPFFPGFVFCPFWAFCT
jgi:hypothetical protein